MLGPVARRVVAVAAAGIAVVVAAGPAATAAPGPWYEASMDDGVPPELADGWGWTATSAGHAGAGLATRMATGDHWGASGHVELREIGAAGADELYWRYWLWLDPDFYVEPPSRGKLPGPAGLYTYNCLGNRVSTPSGPCWSARTMFSRTYPSYGEPGYPDGPDDVTQLGSYVYHLDGPDNRGDAFMWDDDVAQLRHGRWYCVEGQVRMNSLAGADGQLRGWVDGRLALELTDLRFRRPTEPGLHVKSFWMDVYHGGKEPSARDNDIRVDSLALGPARIGCDDGDRFAGRFRDDDHSVHEDAIEWLAAAGVTRGCNPPTNDRFCPDAPVTRGQMAAFLQRTLHLPGVTGDPFVDDDGSRFEPAVEALAAAGITRGCNPPTNDRFCPDAPVTRGQMAAFLQRAHRLPGVTGDSFVDDDGHRFAAAIEALAAAGITRGCNPPANDRFCPDEPVTRAQMATFLRRAASA